VRCRPLEESTIVSSPLRFIPWLAISIAGVLAACGPKIPDVVKIGVAEPLSGPSAARGQDVVDGARLAAVDLNASNYKIAGKPVRIEIVAMDDKADKDEARKVAEAMVEQKVTAVIGHLSSDITEVVIPIYAKADIPQLFTSTAVELTALGKGNTFRLIGNDALQARAIASFAGETLRAKKVAILYEKTAFGTPLAEGITAGLAERGKTVELSEGIDTKRVEFSDFLKKLKAAKPDVFVAVIRDNQLLPLFDQMLAAGLGDIPVVASHVAKTEKVLAAPPSVKTLYVTSSSADPSEFRGGRQFLDKFRAAYKSEPVWAAHYAYDAVYVLAETMRRLDSVDPAAIRARLKTIDAIAPVSVTMRFDANGEQRYGAISVYQKVNSKWEPMVRSDRW
jgi:branched-chain amino acid transport system substrate-binding protein